MSREERTEDYKRLKRHRLEAADKFSYINILAQRLLVLVDSTDSDIYDYENLLTDIRLTAEELNNYCREYGDMINGFSEV